jgi:acetylglutamate kinase
MMIVKFGGHAMTDADGLFASSIALALSKGEKVIVVHGGGPQINAELSRLNIESTFVNGFRYTTEEIFEVVENVLTKDVGPEVASNLHSNGIKARAISGKDSNILTGSPIEGLGKVGKISKVNIEPIQEILDAQIVPVIAPIAKDITGGSGLNINADLAAAAISAAYKGSTLIIMTDVAGIYRHWPDESSLICEITSSELSKLKSSFSDGMLPKVQAVLEAVDAGAQTVRIIDGTNEKSFEEALSGRGGTLVRA